MDAISTGRIKYCCALLHVYQSTSYMYHVEFDFGLPALLVVKMTTSDVKMWESRI